MAMIGTGMIGAVQPRSARDAGAEVIGVLGSSPSSLRAAAHEWEVEKACRSLAELFDDRPDLIQICTPTVTHRPYALAVIEAGINIVCEKPLALTTNEAEELVLAADRAGVVATVPFAYRYHPLVRKIRARRIAGEFGDIGSYWRDLAEFVSGERFMSVSAAMSITYPARSVPAGRSFGGAGSRDDAPQMTVTTEDTAVAAFMTGSGVPGNVVISQVSAGRKNRLWLEIDGTQESAVFDQRLPTRCRLAPSLAALLCTVMKGRCRQTKRI